MNEEEKCKCGSVILKGLGYEDICHNCKRKELMEMHDEEISDELTRRVYIHKDKWELYEAIRRILLSMNNERIDKKTVQDTLNKCFKHTMVYRGTIQIFSNAVYHIDGKDVAQLYKELGIKNEVKK